MKSKILVVEDERSIREGLVDLLAFKGYAPVAACDGAEGQKKIQEERFSVMVLDVMLPYVDGFSLCAQARAQQPSAGIILLTAKSQEEDIVRGFEAGCDDYITKPFSLKQFLLRLAALERRIELPQQTSSLKFSPELLKITYQDQSLEVSKRDMEVLCYLHNRQDRIVGREELLRDIWGYKRAEDVQTRCVDMHITKLRRKIRVLLPSFELIHTVRGAGYRMVLPT